VIFVVYDESYGAKPDSGYNGLVGGPVYMVAVSPYTLGVGALTINTSHYNLLSTWEWLLGLPATGSGHDGTSSFPAMKALFRTSSPTEYTVTFTESGLPSSTEWWVNLTDGPTFSSTTPSLTFAEPNGTYDYTAATTDKAYEPTVAGGSFEVNGASVSESVTFNRVTYTVTFTESGLPSGTRWSVTLDGTLHTSTTTTIMFKEPNGTYSLTVTPPIGFTASPTTGPVDVNGVSQLVSVTMTPWASGGAAIAELYTVYNGRADLQAAFPDVYGNFTNYTKLVNWAGGVVTGSFTDGANLTLHPFGYFYALMMVYDGRSDLQSAYPDAFTNFADYTLLVNWAGGVVTGRWTDSNSSTLAPFGYYYALMMVYDGRSDLQSAFPHAFADESSYQALLVWANDVVLQVFTDSAYTTLLPFAASYEALG
jgi:hypothetical protein